MDDSVLEILDFVKLKGSLKTHVIKNKIVEMISDRLKASIPNIAALAKDLELLKLICNCVENSVLKKYKLDKKEIVLSIVKACFPVLSEPEMKIIEGNIETLHYNGLIRKVSFHKKIVRWLLTPKKKD
jgi:hypothetical protein